MKSTIKLTERDIQILLDLYKMRYLSLSQVQRLHFPSEQTTYRRLRALRDLGLVSHFSSPNIDEGIFRLEPKGLRLVAEHLQVDPSDLTRKEPSAKPRDYLFLQHFLAITDFRIALTQACGKSSLSLLGFIPESHGEKTTRGGVTKYIRDVVCDMRNEKEVIGHTPEATVALEKDGKAAMFFIEIDRGTETVADEKKGILKCVCFYLSYLAEGKYQRYSESFRCEPFKGFRALIVTTSDQRLQNCRVAAKALEFPVQGKRFIWGSTFDQVKELGPLGPIWKSLDVEDQQTYRIG